MAEKSISIVVAMAVTVAGCSSKPRNFDPRLSATPVDSQVYEAQLQSCREEAANSVKKGSRLGSAAAGTAAGTGAGVAVGSAAAGAGTVMGPAAAVAGAMLITAVPVFAIAGAWGVAKIKKNKKERTVKAVMASCLEKSGYSVAGWRVMSKREFRALAARQPVVTQAAPAVPKP